ncbi:hypothetical protein Tsubulata_033639 [Turnera subulata]|uniref:NAC domain-containing protein n=1 Tax=Turnera subulata TaxID=218843 RepID=A0A9Q0JK24_9ROSI|nr:hypothetical protein Tsubulata_033639 [Turnera subulata]
MVPHGFRFNPTDEELVEILDRKAMGQEMPLHFIVEANVYEQEPQNLEWIHTAALSNNERYYYCKREVNDSRGVPGRGWWKATSHFKKVFVNQHLVGSKRPLTFHRFKADDRSRNNAIKSNWIMHEYSLESRTTGWRLCKIKYKGKPSLQEEMEGIRQRYSSSKSHDSEEGSSSTSDLHVMDCSVDHNNQLQLQDQQPLVLQDSSAAMLVDDAYYPHHQQQTSCQLWEQQPSISQTSGDNNDLFLQSLMGYSFLEQQGQYFDQSDEEFTGLWSWQN